MNHIMQDVLRGLNEKRASAGLTVNPSVNDALNWIQNNPGDMHNMGDFGGAFPVHLPKSADEEQGEGQEKSASAEATEFDVAYATGFSQKCAEHGIDPRQLTGVMAR
jgi:hypothetical protein